MPEIIDPDRLREHLLRIYEEAREGVADAYPSLDEMVAEDAVCHSLETPDAEIGVYVMVPVLERRRDVFASITFVVDVDGNTDVTMLSDAGQLLGYGYVVSGS